MVDRPKKSRRWSILSRSAEPSPEPERPKSFSQLPARLTREEPEQQPPLSNTRIGVLSRRPSIILHGRKGPARLPGIGMAPLKEEEEHGKKDTFFHLNGLRYLKSTSKNRSSSNISSGGEGRMQTQHTTGSESSLFPKAEQRLEQGMAYPVASVQPTPMDHAGTPRRVPEPSAWAATSAALASRTSTMATTSLPAAINTRRWSETSSSRPQSIIGPIMSSTIPSPNTSRVSSISVPGTLVNPTTTPLTGLRIDTIDTGIPFKPRAAGQVSSPIAATIVRQPSGVSQNRISIPNGTVSKGTDSSTFPPKSIHTATTPVIPTTAEPARKESRRRSDPGSTATDSNLASAGVPQPNTQQSQRNWAEISEEFLHGKRQALVTQHERITKAPEPEKSRKNEIFEAIKREQENDNKIRDAISNDPLSPVISDHGVVLSAASISSNHTRSSGNASKSTLTLVPTPSVIRSNRIGEELAKLHAAQQQDERLSEMEGFPGLSAHTEMPRPEGFLPKPVELGPGIPRPLEQIAELHSDHIPEVRHGGDVVHPSLIPGRHNHRRAATDVRYKDIATDMTAAPSAPKQPVARVEFGIPLSSGPDSEQPPTNDPAHSEPTRWNLGSARRQSEPNPRPHRVPLPSRSSTGYGHHGTRPRSATVLTPPSVRVIPPTPPSSANPSPLWDGKGPPPNIKATFEHLDQQDAAVDIISEVVSPPELLTSSKSKTEPQIAASTPEYFPPQVYVPPPPPPPPAPPATPTIPGIPGSSAPPTHITPQEQFSPILAIVVPTFQTTPPATPPEARLPPPLVARPPAPPETRLPPPPETRPPPPLPPKPLPYSKANAPVVPTTILNPPAITEASRVRSRVNSLASSKHTIPRPLTPETDNQPLLACLGDDYTSIHQRTSSLPSTRPATTESEKQPVPGLIREDSQPKPLELPSTWVPPNPYESSNPQGEGAKLAHAVSRRTKLREAVERANGVVREPQPAHSGGINAPPKRVNTIPRKPVPMNTAGQRYINGVLRRET